MLLALLLLALRRRTPIRRSPTVVARDSSMSGCLGWSRRSQSRSMASWTRPVWAQAAILDGFSQFSPTDGVPAADSTEILVWYSPTAIHFGIRAYEAHGSVHATLADRDRIAADDHVQILLSTFNDGRQASVFAVNPLVSSPTARWSRPESTSGNGFNNAVVKREAADLSPDFVFESKGRLTEYGYEVELRIPVQEHPVPAQAGADLGHQHRSPGAAFRTRGFLDAGQAGQRVLPGPVRPAGGLSDLRRGLVLDLTPSVTSQDDRQPTGRTGGIMTGGGPELGGRCAGASPTT